MNKLLIILLLFFPANLIAETLTLNCEKDTDDFAHVLHLHFSSKNVSNNAGLIVGTKLRQSGNMIYFESSSNLIIEMRRTYPEFKKSTTRIDRTTGKMVDRLYPDKSGEVIEVYFTCKKTSKKRKF